MESWDDMCKALAEGKLVLAPHCNEEQWEEKVGEKTKEFFESLGNVQRTGKAKALCIPLEQPPITSDTKCSGTA